jgi:hypothetical protein
VPNKEERMDVVVTSLFLNETMPPDWNQPFEWKPSVVVNFKKVDSTFKEVGEEMKARVKGPDNLWMFAAMGGRNAKGHFFDLMTESGDHPKPWTSFTPLAELFKDGSSKRIQAPTKDGTAAHAAPAAQTPSKPSTPSTPSISPGPSAPAKTEEKKPNYKERASFFFDQIAKPQSDAWWTLKNDLSFDCADAVNALQMSSDLAKMEVAKHAGTAEELRVQAAEAIAHWLPFFHVNIRTLKVQNMRERLTHLIGITVKADHLNYIMERAYAELPLEDFELVRGIALTRYETIKANNLEISGTIQPSIQTIQKEEAKDEDIPF